MKKIVLTLFCVCGCMLCHANPISGKTARQVAYNYLTKKTNVTFEELNLVYSQHFPQSEDTAYFVYAVGHSSFVIVAGDDIAKPIWGYSTENGFSKDIPENVKGFLDDLVGELQVAKKQGVKSDSHTQQLWLQLT